MTAWSDTDQQFMREAIAAAKEGADAAEVPVGACLVMHREVIARASNRTIRDCDPSGHAEIVVLRAAAKTSGNYRLGDATLYVTLEPCTMCVGAIVQARVGRVVFGAYDERAGALGSVMDLSESAAFNHRFEVNGGLLEEECREVLSGFFAERRQVPE